MSYIASNLVLFGLLAAIFYATGHLLENLVWPQGVGDPAPLLRRLTLGAGVWIYLLFGLAAAGLLGSATVWAAVGVVALGAALQWSKLGKGTRPPGRLVASATEPGSVILAAALALMVVALFLQTLWPQVSWDANTYHLTVPRLWAEHHGFRRIPFNVYSNWPLNIELLFGLALLLRDHVLAKLVHFGFGCLTLALVYAAARREASSWAGWVAAVLLLANPVVLLEIRVAYVDIAFACFFVVAFLCVHHALEERLRSARLLMLAGVFAGVAAGSKLTGLVAALSLAILLTAEAVSRREKVATAFGDLTRLLLPASLLLAPWLVKSWLVTGNPVYPFFYHLFGGPEWSSELGQQLADWQQSIGMGRSWLDYLLLPLRVIVAGARGYERFDGEILLLWLLLVPLSVWAAARRPIVRRSLWVAGIYFVFWSVTSQQIRLLIPILPFLALAAAVSLSDVVNRLLEPPGGVRVRLAVGVGLAVLLAVNGWSFAARSYGMLRDYLRLGAEVKSMVVHPIYETIDKTLPADAKLMLLNTNHGFFLRREFIADSFFEASQISALLAPAENRAAVAEELAELGVTHLLIENRDRRIPYPRALLELLTDRELSRLIHRSSDGRYDLVELSVAPLR